MLPAADSAADAPGDLVPVEVRQPHVDERDVGLQPQRRVHALGTVRRFVHLVAGAREDVVQHLA